MTAHPLATNDHALASLWAVVNAKRRKGSTTVKVDADALAGLLRDHHALVSSSPGRITIGPDCASLVGALPAKDFADLAKAIEQSRAARAAK